jgi:hypothetical protein
LERAQDRDGLHIDLFEIAKTMLKFAEDNVVWREKQNGEKLDSAEEVEIESDGEKIESESSSTSSRDDTENSERKLLKDENLGNVLSTGESNSLEESLLRGQNLGMLAPVAADLLLEPLSGEHLKAVKRLAGYFRLRWSEQGSGKCRRLILHAKSGPQAPAETAAAEMLISKYNKIENGVTTKRLPTARCTPQVSGTQVNSLI